MTTHKDYVKTTFKDSAIMKYANMIRHEMVYPDNTEYRYICQIHKEYERIIDTLRTKGSIMTPIRGIYMSNYNKSSIQKALDLGATVASKKNDEGEVDTLGKYTIDKYKEFRANSQVIGYAVATDIDKLTQNSGVVKYCMGVSICTPDDFTNFNKEIGIVMAWYDLFDINVDNAYPVEELVGYDSITKFGKTSWYYLPFTIEEQIKEFTHRCERYFAYKYYGTTMC